MCGWNLLKRFHIWLIDPSENSYDNPGFVFTEEESIERVGNAKAATTTTLKQRKRKAQNNFSTYFAGIRVRWRKRKVHPLNEGIKR